MYVLVSYPRLQSGSLERDSTLACLHWLSKRQESGWGEVLRKSALSLAAVAVVAAPISFAPQEVKQLGFFDLTLPRFEFWI